ncbi:hypothetical protein CFOL_v3_17973 [Cephalotus follicularis]|uniref:RING-type domain-containing protein n=1 Tax=Cephalotus follicularis TaxID=3775 RepID=A0A1Q3C377_CEPFO|nr:hypothetical protein CFOL_v3_17973 [Cephalotus follicularis]
MGFDNECILNIQSLAGEYFCPVCRLLVYPNEALQSQCTHLYCKSCLTYVVSTTQACPYDGYLVTEADSKPLVESNKALAETIGKITVHCLYHRSGCTWQGPLSECTSHCSGCAFGNSPVVCNRCGLQIVCRQVQEHAQNCQGAQSQVQQAEVTQNAAATSIEANSISTQTASQAGGTASQALAYHSAAAPNSGQDSNQQVNSNSQAQAVVQVPVPTPEQWYQQQQQQYQQYYQQYPGYDAYQQQYVQYYPYQQQAVIQFQQQPQLYIQPQSQLQAQVQPQSHSQPQSQPHGLPQSHVPVQAPVPAQPQNQAPVNPQQTHSAVQPHPQTQTQIQSYPHPQPLQPHFQNVQMPQYQQTQSQTQHLQPLIQGQAHSQHQLQHQPVPQAQPQAHSQLQPPQSNHPLIPVVQPQSQYSSAQAVAGRHSYPLQQPQQQMQVGAPQQYLMHTHTGSHFQMQNQYTQPNQMRPPTTILNQQQPALMPSPGQGPNVPHAQVQPHAHQSGPSVNQRPLIQQVQHPIPQQHGQQQQPFGGQPLSSVQNQIHQQGPFVQQQQQQQQQIPMQSQLCPQVPPHPFQQYSQTYPQQQQQPHQSQNLSGRSQPYPHSGSGLQVRPILSGANLPSSNQNNLLGDNQFQLTSDQQSGANVTEKRVTKKEAEAFPKTDKKDAKNVDGHEASAETKIPKIESDVKFVDDEHKIVGKVEDKSTAIDASAKEFQSENSDLVTKGPVKEEAAESNKNNRDVDVGQKQPEHSLSKDKEIQEGSVHKRTQLREELSGKLQEDTNLPPVQDTTQGPGINESRFFTPPIGSSLQPRPAAPLMVQAPPLPEPPQQSQFLGHPNTQIRPQGLGHMPHPGQSMFKHPHGPDIPLGGTPGPGSTTSFGRAPSHYGPPQHGFEPQSVAPQGPYNQGQVPYGLESQMGQQGSANRMEADMFPHIAGSLERGPVGHSSNLHSNMRRMNGVPGPDEHVNQFPVDPAGRVFDRLESEDDFKKFPRPFHLDAEPVPKFGGYFSSSRPHDRGPHGFGIDIGSKLDHVAGTGPAASRFLAPSHIDLGERPVGLHEEHIGRPDSARTHPEFLGPLPGYGRHHMDGLNPRSPIREYPGIYSHGFRGPSGALRGSRSGLDDIDGRTSHRFGDFRESRLPISSSHLHRGEFDGPGNMRIGDHLMGHDSMPGHSRRGEHFGSRNLRVGQPGFGSFPGPSRMGEFPPPRPGEPGFRSTFPLHGFSNNSGVFRGEMESFENSRKRKPASMGWCRICKVDCETVEGLDLHSQTRDHQKMAMDMVVSIKQKAKKQKLNSSEPSSLDDASKSRNASFDHGNKH